MLRVTNVQEASGAPCIVGINSYVPISFRSRSEPIAGARYVLLGNSKTQLLELQFPAESLVLSGFTLVLGQGSSRGTLTGNGPSVVGLPIVTLPEGENFSGAGGNPRLTIRTEICISCIAGQAEVRLGSAKTFNRSVAYGRVQFLVLDDVLVGLRVVNLTEEEQKILYEYIDLHPAESSS
jgi:hypothetical protein